MIFLRQVLNKLPGMVIVALLIVLLHKQGANLAIFSSRTESHASWRGTVLLEVLRDLPSSGVNY